MRYVRVLMPFLPAAAGLTVLQAASRGYGVMGPYVLENVAVAALRPVLVALSVALGLGAVALALSWGAPLAIGFTNARDLAAEAFGGQHLLQVEFVTEVIEDDSQRRPRGL